MMLLNDYSVAVYSATGCEYFSSRNKQESAHIITGSLSSPPRLDELQGLQKTLLRDFAFTGSRLIVVVPDAWLSVSHHSLDHQIPASLQPLAALSFAAENTFCHPDQLLFGFHYQVLAANQSRLSVFACTHTWFEHLCLPFQPGAKNCRLIPASQWQDLSLRRCVWAHCEKHALSAYQPEKAKRLKSRRLGWFLAGFSVLLHASALSYWQALNAEAYQSRKVIERVQQEQSAWRMDSSENVLTEPVLRLTQGLPSSVRLDRFESYEQSVQLQMMLSKDDLALLLGSWKKQQPNWKWVVEQQTYPLRSPSNQREVVGASITISRP